MSTPPPSQFKPTSRKSKRPSTSSSHEIPPTDAITSSDDESNLPMVITTSRSSMYKPDGHFDDELFFTIIGNDVRRKILMKLAKFPRYASDLSIDLGVSKQAIKKHLDQLIDFGLVEIASSSVDQKKQFYQINPKVAIFSQIDLTPNYFDISVQNNPEDLIKGMKSLEHNPRTAVTSSMKSRIDYAQLNFALKSLGSQLQEVEEQIASVESQRKQILFQKTLLLNRIQMIINSLVENDLEKEIIFSFFFDTSSTIEGLTLQDILDKLFLRRKQRAGISKTKYLKTDQKTLERGKELLNLLQVLMKNFSFIRGDQLKLFFNFEPEFI